MKVTHVITTLAMGGAQTALFRLVTAPGDARHAVVSLTDEGAFGAQLAALGVPVTCLGMRPGVPDPRAVPRLLRVLRRDRPDVVQSWMYHANLLASPAAALAGLPLVWNIRHADVRPDGLKPLTRLTNALCARVSRAVPDRIVCCAASALRAHGDAGYDARRMLVIPNGFDLDAFAGDPAARARVRAELGLAAQQPVVGLLARVHPDKDHGTFLAAARIVARERPDAAFVLAGAGAEPGSRLAARVDALGLAPQARLLGVRRDVPALLSALDVLVSSSRTEAFPQVLGEAMACGVPCVATDCGDSRDIVGAAGRVVPPGDAAALASAVLEVLALPDDVRAAMGAAGRKRVRERYDQATVLQRYADLYEDVARRHGARA